MVLYYCNVEPRDFRRAVLIHLIDDLLMSLPDFENFFLMNGYRSSLDLLGRQVISPFVQGGRYNLTFGMASLGWAAPGRTFRYKGSGDLIQCLDAEPSLTGVLVTPGPGWKGGIMAPAVWVNLKDSRPKNGIRRFKIRFRGDFCHTIRISESGGENAKHSLTTCSPAGVE